MTKIMIFLKFLNDLLPKLFKWSSTKFNEYRKNRKAKKELKNLDSAEKSVLREFFIEGKNSLKMPINEQSVSRLLKYFVLSSVDKDIIPDGNLIFQNLEIREKIRKKLHKKSSKLIQYYNDPTKEQKEFINKNRFDKAYHRIDHEY